MIIAYENHPFSWKGGVASLVVSPTVDLVFLTCWGFGSIQLAFRRSSSIVLARSGALCVLVDLGIGHSVCPVVTLLLL